MKIECAYDVLAVWWRGRGLPPGVSTALYEAAWAARRATGVDTSPRVIATKGKRWRADLERAMELACTPAEPRS